MRFTLQQADPKSNARAGLIETDHGQIETPMFMPVGTAGTVKAIHTRDLISDIQAQIILGNTYHLYLRPGVEIIRAAGGIHRFMQWERPLLTDSGGYQVYSLAGIRKLTEEGVKFQSHIDGSTHLFSPEKVIEIQRDIGADIIMAFDECTPYPCAPDYAMNSMEITHRWLGRCLEHFKKTSCTYGYRQSLFPIVQGSVYKDLREKSAAFIAGVEAEGNAIGGLSVGEPHEAMYEITDIVCRILPQDKPRYLMGVGTPANILESIALGVDLFDCVMPTRNGRNGMLFTSEGIINMKNEKWKNDHSPVDAEGNSFVDRQYSRAYLRHLFASNEMLGAMIASTHNLNFYLWLMKASRKQIKEGNYASWKDKMVKRLERRL